MEKKDKYREYDKKEKGGFKVTLDEVFVGDSLRINLDGNHLNDPAKDFIKLLAIDVIGFQEAEFVQPVYQFYLLPDEWNVGDERNWYLTLTTYDKTLEIWKMKYHFTGDRFEDG
jgi:hypothetical protein